MVDRNRKTVEYPASLVDIEHGTLGSALERIQKLINCHGPSARIDYYEPPYSDSIYLYVYTTRAETDAEYNLRISAEERYEHLREDVERKEYERLQKKFANSTEKV